jgi:16S rRNA C967 or C1407 C5-methylase (RsmB/RsmF family)
MAQQMIYTPEEEADLMRTIWTPDLADDPYSFVMFAFPWGKKGTPLEHFSGPRTWQKEVLQSIAEHIKKNKDKRLSGAFMDALKSAVSSGRGIGKSALVSWLVLWMLSTRIGSTTIVSANSEAQLRSVTWAELTKWCAMSINSHWFEVSATKLFPAKWLSDLVERDLKKGTRYWAAEGKLWSEENPDSYAGVHNHDGMMVIFDESSGIPSSIWDVAAGYFTEPILDRYWMAFSNPRRNDGYFFEC